MSRAVFLVFGGFAAGLGVGLLLHWRGDDRADVDEASAQRPAAAAPANDAASELVGEAETVAEIELAKGGDRSVEALIATVPVSAIEPGTGVITGRVLTEAGEPVARVLIRAHPNQERRARPPLASALEEEPSLPERVRQVIEEERWCRASRRETRSGEDGSFTLSGLAQASYWIEAHREGYTVSSEDRHGGSLRPGDEVELTARLVLAVPLAVLMPDGSPAVAAQVRVQTVSGKYSRALGPESAWSPERPRIQLTPGAYTLRAVHGENEEMASASEDVVIEAGAPVPMVSLQLRSRPGIQGQVIFDPSDELRFADVHLLRMHASNPPDLKRLCNSDRSTSAHRDSGYAFTDLTSGAYLISVSRSSNGRILAAEVVEVADQMVTHDVVMPPLQRSEYLVLWVHGANGDVLTDVEITTDVHTANGGSSSGSGGELRRRDGSFWVLHREWCGRTDHQQATHSITVRTENYPPMTVEYQRAEATEVVVQFTAPAFLEVMLAEFAPEAYEGTFGLGIQAAEDAPADLGEEGLLSRGQRSYPRQQIDGDESELNEGHARFGPLMPGSYVVTLSYQSKRRGTIPVQTLPLAVRSGRNAAILPVPRLFRLKIAIDDAGTSTRLQLRSVRKGGMESWSLEDEVGADGMAVLDGLPPGDYTLTCYGDDRESGDMVVSVPAQTEVRFRAREVSAMRLTVRDADGALAKAGLRTDDLIVGVNGAEFKSQNQWWALLQQAPPGKEVKVLVERGNDRFEIALHPRDLMVGDTLEPASR